jgi:large subunit ribosomal protein L29
MKKHELAALSADDMKQRIKESKQRIADVNFNKQIEPPQNPMAVRNLRKDIARLKTRLNAQKNAQKKDAEKKQQSAAK